MLTIRINSLFFFFCIVLSIGVYAQDFGFGFDDDAGEAASGLPVSVKIGGEISVELAGYVYDFSSREKMKDASLGDIVSGALNFSAAGANADAYIVLDLSASSFKDLINYNPGNSVYTPIILDEAYLRAFFGPVNIEAGLRKLTWGKADSLGPLDVINPLDYTDLRKMDDLQAIKITRPLVHVSWNTGDFSKLEAVFIPNFAGNRYARGGRWMPSQFKDYQGMIKSELMNQARGNGNWNPSELDVLLKLSPVLETRLFDYYQDILGGSLTRGLEYFQTGLRFTGTVGSSDIGVQYFYGNLFRPDFTGTGIDAFLSELKSKIDFDPLSPSLGNVDLSILSPLKYTRYHQIGFDYAQVLFSFNIRAEFAVHLTEDMKGRDGSTRNPFLAWSLGFDRDIVWGMNANVQCNETIRLMNDGVGNNPLFDCEAGTRITFTRMTVKLSKKFLKDEFECKVITLWGIEDRDCYIIPSVTWNIRDITAELSSGVFAGRESGEFGQFWNNSFVRLGMKYTF